MLTAFFKLLTKTDFDMKRVIAGIVLSAMFFGCQEGESPTELTGNEMAYALEAGSEHGITGTAKFVEKKDGSTVISIKLEGTDGNVQLPVHLHLGDVSQPDAEVAALLTPVSSATGKSQTVLTNLADGSPVTYAQLATLGACIKVHLADSGPERDIVLAAGNIGSAASARTSGEIAVCKSE